MTDLEATRLCAEAMGWRPAGTRPDFETVKAIPVEQFPGACHYQYAPLHDYSDAFALAERFMLSLDFFAGSAELPAVSENSHRTFSDESMMRAIVYCVAAMQRAKGAG